MAKTRTMYMHTLDGEPAGFQDDHGTPHVYFAHGSFVTLAPTLRELRRQQRACDRDRKKAGFSPNAERYGYVRVQVPIP